MVSLKGMLHLYTSLCSSELSALSLLKNRSPESYMNLSQKNPKVVMIIFGINLLCTITVFFSGFQIEDSEERVNYYRTILVPVFLASFCILLKVNEDEYGMAKQVMRKRGKIIRRSIRVEGMLENFTDPLNIEDSSQAQVCYRNTISGIF